LITDHQAHNEKGKGKLTGIKVTISLDGGGNQGKKGREFAIRSRKAQRKARGRILAPKSEKRKRKH